MRTFAIAGLVGLVAACGDDGSGEPAYDPGPPPYEILSDWQFFDGELALQIPTDDVIPYTVAAPLWADFAGKGRYFKLPEDGEDGEPAKIGFTDTNEWSFPLGTIFIKTFFFDVDRSRDDDDPQIVETRLLIHEDEGWTSYIYVWNDEQTEATRVKGGADVQLAYTDAEGQPATQLYLVPDQNTCKDCHVRDDVVLPLGPITHQLNVQTQPDLPIAGKDGNQIDLLAELGVFASPPAPASSLPAFVDPAGDADLDARARSYLHGNCAHCHRPGGGGGPSGLTFVAWEEDPAKFGVCKVPAAAGGGAGGRQVDIFPGDPEASIVPFRMGSTDPEIKMPELPSLLSDEFGTALITEWITAMSYPPCG